MFHVYCVLLFPTFSTFLKMLTFKKKKSAFELSTEEGMVLNPHEETGLRWREEKAFQLEKAQAETGKK